MIVWNQFRVEEDCKKVHGKMCREYEADMRNVLGFTQDWDEKFMRNQHMHRKHVDKLTKALTMTN